ncbi:MAG: tRNA guanosine(34) transglycosylase Tgt [Candidatus Fermentibacteraceae bacterium]
MGSPPDAGQAPGFTLHGCSGRARHGTLHLARGHVETPVFMPVGTQASVKTVRNSDLTAMGYHLILANTYHLYLRPGAEVIGRVGGLHEFMGWDGCLLTDSGGFQVYSLAELSTVTEKGYRFRSHIDGSSHLLTPEKVLEVQQTLGSDVMMVLDECLEQPSGRRRTEESLELTLRWAERSRRAYGGGPQALFGIVQGGAFPRLRARAARELVEMGFDGYAIGGVAVGEKRPMMEQAVNACIEILPHERPRYLMGVGRPEDLVDFAGMGVDMFDCVVPTRNARGGSFFVPGGHINIRNARFRDDTSPVQPGCPCYACRNHSRAYLRHLFMSREWMAPILTTLHNLQYFATLMQEIRRAVREDRYDDFAADWHRRRAGFDSRSW